MTTVAACSVHSKKNSIRERFDPKASLRSLCMDHPGPGFAVSNGQTPQYWNLLEKAYHKVGVEMTDSLL